MKGLLIGALFVGLPVAAVAEVLKARLEWAHTVDMRFVEDGVVEKVHVLQGQAVSQGQMLAALDQRDFEIALAEARARIVRAEAAQARADRQLSWAQELYDRGLISDNERLEAEEGAAEAQAEAELTQAGLRTAEIALERSVLESPLDGVVVELRSWPGQVVVKALQRDPLIVVADGRRMVARARLTADAMSSLKPGEPAMVRLERGDWRKGYIYRLGVESEDISERGAVYALDVVFPVAPGEGLRPGQFAQVQLER